MLALKFGISVLVLHLIFFGVYTILSHINKESFEAQKLSELWLFTTKITTKIGPTDLSPKSTIAKIFVMLHSLVIFLFGTAGIAIGCSKLNRKQCKETFYNRKFGFILINLAMILVFSVLYSISDSETKFDNFEFEDKLKDSVNKLKKIGTAPISFDNIYYATMNQTLTGVTNNQRSANKANNKRKANDMKNCVVSSHILLVFLLTASFACSGDIYASIGKLIFGKSLLSNTICNAAPNSSFSMNTFSLNSQS
tara:strand:+ start:418 stop:1176 length:759 start_codon:yes stop_codon:yes gene_type:complete